MNDIRKTKTKTKAAAGYSSSLASIFWSVLSARRYRLGSLCSPLCSTLFAICFAERYRKPLAIFIPHCECGVIAPTALVGSCRRHGNWGIYVQDGHPHRRCLTPHIKDEGLMCGVCDGARAASRGDALKSVYS